MILYKIYIFNFKQKSKMAANTGQDKNRTQSVMWKLSRNCLTDFQKSFYTFFGRLIVFALFLIIILIIVILFLLFLLSFFGTWTCPWQISGTTGQNFMNGWSYRYMFLVGPKVFSFVVKGVKVIFWGVQRGWGLL